MTPSIESFTKLKTSSFPHFLFPRFSVCIDAIISISNSLSSIAIGLSMSGFSDVVLIGSNIMITRLQLNNC